VDEAELALCVCVWERERERERKREEYPSRWGGACAERGLSSRCAASHPCHTSISTLSLAYCYEHTYSLCALTCLPYAIWHACLMPHLTITTPILVSAHIYTCSIRGHISYIAYILVWGHIVHIVVWGHI
jgi:hypothetical protein